MATLLVENVPPPHPFDAIAVDIERRYEGIVNVVRERKRTLLTRLSEFREEYDSLLSNRDRTERELKSTKETIDEFKENDLKTMQQEFLSKIEDKIEKLRVSTANYSVRFECKSEELEKRLSQLGGLEKVDYEIKLPNYSEMESPVVAVVREGKGKDEFSGPTGIAFDEETQLIYVCDISIKIFSIEGRFMSEFGRNILYRPWGIVLSRDSVYVTSRGQGEIFQFNINTHELIKRAGKIGTGNGEFRHLSSLAIGPDGDLYAADTLNNRISVHDPNLKYKRRIEYGLISSPIDVKFTISYMLILSHDSLRRVHLLTLQGEYLKSIIIIKSGVCGYFCIDGANNILVSIWEAKLVRVYNEEGELLHSIGKGWLHYPSGVTTTRSGRLIVVSHHKDHGLLIF